MLKRAVIVILYIFYALVLTIVLLVARFPKEKFLNWTVDWVEREAPGVRCGVDDVAYIYPASFRFDRMLLTGADERFAIPLTDVVISLDLKRPFQDMSLRFNLFGGEVRTDVSLHDSAAVIELPNLTVAGIDLTAVEPLQNRLERPVSGIFAFDGRYLGSRSDLGNGEFAGDVKINDLFLILRRPILQSTDVAFSEMTATARLQSGLLTITEGKATGASYDGTFAGQVRLFEPWQESELEISGDVVPHQEYLRENQQAARAVALLNNKYGEGALGYEISGSFREPQFRFGAQ